MSDPVFTTTSFSFALHIQIFISINHWRSLFLLDPNPILFEPNLILKPIPVFTNPIAVNLLPLLSSAASSTNSLVCLYLSLFCHYLLSNFVLVCPPIFHIFHSVHLPLHISDTINLHLSISCLTCIRSVPFSSVCSLFLEGSCLSSYLN